MRFIVRIINPVKNFAGIASLRGTKQSRLNKKIMLKFKQSENSHRANKKMKQQKYFKSIIVPLILFFSLIHLTFAATFSFSTPFGTYKTDSSISIDLLISSTDRAAGTASGLISFPKDLLSVDSVSYTDSVVDSWSQKPSFSNSSGNLNFEGVFLSPGYIGNDGKLLTITFKAKVATGTANVSFVAGSILAADDDSTNILVHSGSAIFDISDVIDDEKTTKEIFYDLSSKTSTSRIYDAYYKFVDLYSSSFKNIINSISVGLAFIVGILYLIATSLYKLVSTVLSGIFGLLYLIIITAKDLLSIIVKSTYYSYIGLIDGIYFVSSSITVMHVFIAIALLLLSLLFYFWYKSYKKESSLKKEIIEAKDALHEAFRILKGSEEEQIDALEKSKSKHKSNKAKDRSTRQFKKDLSDAEKYVEKEIGDIDRIS